MTFATVLLATFLSVGCSVRVNTGADQSAQNNTGTLADQTAIRSAATRTLQQLDAEQFEQLWPDVASSLKQPGLNSFAQGVRASHEVFGAPKSRTIVGYSFPDKIEGVPPGRYGLVYYRADFTQVEGIAEQVVFVQEGDKWRLAGYWAEKGRNAKVL